MQTRKHKNYKNTTLKKNKNNRPHLKLLKPGFALFAAKKFKGDKILEFNRREEEKTKNHCLRDNSSWFGSLSVAKSYKKPDTQIYKWKIHKPTYLLKTNKENEKFINYIFKNTRLNLTPTITSHQTKNIEYEHPYINMNDNDRALYEFKFAFGYITLKEQYEFLKLVQYLIENNFIQINTREGKNIIKKIKIKITYYNLSSHFSKIKKEKYNRLSIYEFDKYAIMNLCKIVYNKKDYNISGVYQKNDTSFWFPDLIIYKMDIEEYILFNPHHNLLYIDVVE